MCLRRPVLHCASYFFTARHTQSWCLPYCAKVNVASVLFTSDYVGRFLPTWINFVLGLVVHGGICGLSVGFFIEPAIPKQWQAIMFGGALSFFAAIWSVGPWMWQHCFWPDFAGTAVHVVALPWPRQLLWGLFQTPVMLVTAVSFANGKHLHSHLSISEVTWRSSKFLAILCCSAILAAHIYCYCFGMPSATNPTNMTDLLSSSVASLCEVAGGKISLPWHVTTRLMDEL